MKNKQDMVKLVAEVFDIESNKEAVEKFDALGKALLKELIEEGGYKLAGVTVEQKEKKPSKGKCKGVEWTKPAHMTVRAKFSKEVKDLVYREL